MSSPRLTRTELKHLAQEALMQGIGSQLSYWRPQDYDTAIPDGQQEELREVMQREADRVAKLFGYKDGAWRI
ncbi:hypothetical protein ABZ916_25790 [Streptomyces sp. NPDC046853]|uniref:hypothetical protein n=1 Tax=Streptomyces sp. NPDC046853 TaxID=3154920 RepID=UPI003401F828